MTMTPSDAYGTPADAMFESFISPDTAILMFFALLGFVILSSMVGLISRKFLFILGPLVILWALLPYHGFLPVSPSVHAQIDSLRDLLYPW